MTVHGDRVQQATTTTGTGTLSFSLGSATEGHRSFSSAVSTAAEVTYLIQSGVDSAWEIGTGTLTHGSPDTLTRVLISSSTGSLLDLPAGTHTVSLILAAQTIDSFARKVETVYAVVDGATVNLDPNNGSIQTWTLGASRTPDQANWVEGQSITLLVDDGTDYAITWTTLAVVWKTGGGTAPTLQTTGVTAIVLWKVGTTVYGARVGDA